MYTSVMAVMHRPLSQTPEPPSLSLSHPLIGMFRGRYQPAPPIERTTPLPPTSEHPVPLMLIDQEHCDGWLGSHTLAADAVAEAVTIGGTTALPTGAKRASRILPDKTMTILCMRGFPCPFPMKAASRQPVMMTSGFGGSRLVAYMKDINVLSIIFRSQTITTNTPIIVGCSSQW